MTISELNVFFQVYKSLTAQDIPEYIQNIQRDLCAIFSEIATAHFESASQAVRAYHISGRKGEIESAIAHLRDVFNVAKKGIYREKRYSYLFGLITGNEPAFSDSERVTIILQLAMVARLISRIYTLLGEPKNGEMWTKECQNLSPDLKRHLSMTTKLNRNEPFNIEEFTHELRYHKDEIFFELFQANSAYLIREAFDEKFMSPSGGIHRIERYTVRISEAGKQFLLQKLNEG